MGCGSVRQEDRSDNGMYIFMDPETINQDQLAAELFECFLHPYYTSKNIYSDEYLTEIASMNFRPLSLRNVTDSISEYLCVNPSDYIEEKSCETESVVSTESVLTALKANTLTVYQAEVAEWTVGCNECKSNFVPVVTYDSTLGLYYQECTRMSEIDYTKADVPCAELGYIESELTLTCVSCASIIPNCKVCQTSKLCDMCDIGYY